MLLPNFVPQCLPLRHWGTKRLADAMEVSPILPEPLEFTPRQEVKPLGEYSFTLLGLLLKLLGIM